MAYTGQDEPSSSRIGIEAVFSGHIHLAGEQSRLAGSALALATGGWNLDTGCGGRFKQSLSFKDWNGLAGACELDLESAFDGCRRFGRTAGAAENLLADPRVFNAHFSENLARDFHERRRSAEKENAIREIRYSGSDEIGIDVAAGAGPGGIGVGKHHFITEILQARFQIAQLIAKDDVVRRSNAVQEASFSVQAKIVEVAEHGNHRRDPAPGGDQRDFLVFARIETELAERPGSFDRHADRGMVIQVDGHAAAVHALRRDLDIATSGGRRADRVAASLFLTVKQECEREELARLSVELAIAVECEAQRFRIGGL